MRLRRLLDKAEKDFGPVVGGAAAAGVAAGAAAPIAAAPAPAPAPAAAAKPKPKKRKEPTKDDVKEESDENAAAADEAVETKKVKKAKKCVTAFLACYHTDGTGDSSTTIGLGSVLSLSMIKTAPSSAVH